MDASDCNDFAPALFTIYKNASDAFTNATPEAAGEVAMNAADTPAIEIFMDSFKKYLPAICVGLTAAQELFR